MLPKSNLFKCYVRVALKLLLLLSLLIPLGCSDKNAPDSPQEDNKKVAVVFVTDSSEWSVCLFEKGLVYAEAIQVSLPSPWEIPTRDDAAVLKSLEYPNDERFITSDGYTFGMPSASVTKAGQKTKYSVLGLYKRATTIYIQF